jgi:hypothetical protein
MKARAAGVALAIALAAALSGQAAAEEAAIPAPPAARTLLQLTSGHAQGSVANHGVIVREIRTVTIPAGRHTVSWTELPESSVIQTLTVALAGAPQGARVLGQRAQENVYTSGGLSSLMQGAQVIAEDVRAGAGRRGQRAARGTLVSLSDGAVLRVGQEVTALGPTTLHPGPFPARSLAIDVEVPAAGPVGIELTALVTRVEQRRPRYTLRLEPVHDGGGARGTLDGSVIFENLSGYPLDGARAGIARGSAALGTWAGFAIGSAWAAGPLSGLPDPFLLRDPLRFGPTLVAETTVVHAEGLPVSHTTMASPEVVRLFDRDPNPVLLPLARVTDVDTGPAGLRVPLPAGDVVVWASQGPETPAAIVAHGELGQGDVGPAWVTAPEMFARVEARQISALRAGPCRGSAAWAYTIPDALLSYGGFDLVLNAHKEALSVKLRGKSPGRIVVEPARTIVRLPRREGPRPRAEGPGQKVEIDLRLSQCP